MTCDENDRAARIRTRATWSQGDSAINHRTPAPHGLTRGIDLKCISKQDNEKSGRNKRSLVNSL